VAGPNDNETYAQQVADGVNEGGKPQAQAIANYLANLFTGGKQAPPQQAPDSGTCPHCGQQLPDSQPTVGQQIGYPGS
jgi:hypothetical protein